MYVIFIQFWVGYCFGVGRKSTAINFTIPPLLFLQPCSHIKFIQLLAVLKTPTFCQLLLNGMVHIHKFERYLAFTRIQRQTRLNFSIAHTCGYGKKCPYKSHQFYMMLCGSKEIWTFYFTFIRIAKRDQCLSYFHNKWSTSRFLCSFFFSSPFRCFFFFTFCINWHNFCFAPKSGWIG